MESLSREYDLLIEELSEHLVLRGVNPKRITSPDKNPFEQLSLAEKKDCIESTRQLISQYEILGEGVSQADALKAVTLENGLVSSDLSIFEKVENDDYVEVLDINTLKAIYRNEITYRLCNYSVEELHAYSSFILFDRPRWVITELNKLIEDLKKNPGLKDLSSFPPYILQETLTLFGDQYIIRHKYACSALKVGEPFPSAIISTYRIEKINTDNSTDIRII
jgi:hypothetical protein